MCVAQDSVRRLIGAGFIDYLGGGLFLAFSAVYFTQVVGLTAPQVGLGLGLSGLVALVVVVPLGQLADRVGVRRALVVAHLVRAAATLGYATAGGWWSALPAMIVVTVADQSVAAWTQALVAELTSGAERVRVMAKYRTAVNVAISVAGPLGGLAVGLRSPSALRWLLAIAAFAYVLVATLLASMRLAPLRRPEHRRRRLAAFRDRRLVRLAAIDTVLQLWTPVLNLGFPLWLTGHTDAGIGWTGLLYGLATVLCVLLQWPIARLTATVGRARAGQAAAGLALAAACAVFAAAAHTRGHLTPSTFAVAVTLLTLGELLAVAAAWTLSYALAPRDHRAEFLSAFAMGRAVSRYVLGPVLVTAALATIGVWTWALLAALFLIAALAATTVKIEPAPVHAV